MPSDLSAAASPTLRLTRLAVGLVQGGLLYGLYLSFEPPNRVWPATDGFAFAPALLIAWYIPLVFLLGLGCMRMRTLLAWAGAVAVVLTGLAWHDVARRAGAPAILPSITLAASSAPLMFIAHVLAMAADQDRRLIAHYQTYFDIAWKLAVQLFFAAGFVGLFWAMLWLGTALFKLIDLDFLARLIRHAWFKIPATALALAAAIHLTDVRAGIVRAIRTLKLLLLSWLLPLLTAILLVFLGGLPFTGLSMLWKTGHATALLLTAATTLIILINAAYQDGLAEHSPPAVLRHAARVAALLVFPLVAIAAYALSLRIAQYGWTTDRILAVASLAVLACYATGYAWAAIRRGAWLQPLETTNLAAALATIAVLLALLSPIADPTRIAVTDQVARLRSGLIAPEQFDFSYLHRHGHRYGAAALTALAEDEGLTATIRDKASAALKNSLPPLSPRAITSAEITANVIMHPQGTTLPQGFAGHWAKAKPDWQLPVCLRRPAVRCDAVLVDMNGDGIDEILVIPEGRKVDRAVVFKAEAEESWPIFGTLAAAALRCPGVLDNLRAGQFRLTPPALSDLEVAGRRLTLNVPFVEDPACAR